jgi:hypothetical protein
MHDFEDTPTYTSNLEQEIENFRLMYEAEFDPTTTMLHNEISHVVEIKDRCVVDTPDDMDEYSSDVGSSFDSSLGQFEENLDNMDNLNFDAMANIFEEPLHFYPYEPELSNFQPSFSRESHRCPSIDHPLECTLRDYFEHGEVMDFVENDSSDFIVPCLYHTYTLSELLRHTQEKVRTLFDELSWSHCTPTLFPESPFENTVHRSPPPTISSYLDFQIINYKNQKN